MLLTPFTLGVYKRGSARVRPTLFPRCAPPAFNPLHRGQCTHSVLLRPMLELVARRRYRTARVLGTACTRSHQLSLLPIGERQTEGEHRRDFVKQYRRVTRNQKGNKEHRRVTKLFARKLCARRLCARRLCAQRLGTRRLCAHKLCARKLCARGLCARRLCARKLCARKLCARRLCARRLYARKLRLAAPAHALTGGLRGRTRRCRLVARATAR